jgi:hypothetical protein
VTVLEGFQSQMAQEKGEIARYKDLRRTLDTLNPVITVGIDVMEGKVIPHLKTMIELFKAVRLEYTLCKSDC